MVFSGDRNRLELRHELVQRSVQCLVQACSISLEHQLQFRLWFQLYPDYNQYRDIQEILEHHIYRDQNLCYLLDFPELSESNFESWKSRMQLLFVYEGMEVIVAKGFVVPEDFEELADQEQMDGLATILEKDMLAQLYICGMISRLEILDSIRDGKTAKEAWDILKITYKEVQRMKEEKSAEAELKKPWEEAWKKVKTSVLETEEKVKKSEYSWKKLHILNHLSMKRYGRPCKIRNRKPEEGIEALFQTIDVHRSPEETTRMVVRLLGIDQRKKLEESFWAVRSNN